MATVPKPLFVAIVDDSPITVLRVTALLRPFGRRVRVESYSNRLPQRDRADIVLYDPFVLPHSVHRLREIAQETGALVMVFASALDGRQLDEAIVAGAAGFLPKTVDGATMMRALERVSASEITPAATGGEALPATTWPGEREGLTFSESAALSVVVAGMTNEDIASALHVSTETARAHLRSAYSKMGVTSRTQAVSWGIDHGFQLPSSPARLDEVAQR